MSKVLFDPYVLIFSLLIGFVIGSIIYNLLITLLSSPIIVRRPIKRLSLFIGLCVTWFLCQYPELLENIIHNTLSIGIIILVFVYLLFLIINKSRQ